MRLSIIKSLVLMAILGPTAFAEQYRGKLFNFDQKKMAKIRVENTMQDFEIMAPKKYHKYFDKVLMNSPNYTFEFDGKIEGDFLVLQNMPRVVADLDDKIGLLTKNGKDFYLDDQKIKFGRTKDIYGYRFDEISKEYFVGKKVHTQGHMEDGIFVINAIIPADLFSASENNAYPAIEKFFKNPLSFITKKMPKTKYSQSPIPFRGTIRQRENYRPEAGDYFFLVTLSGRQGDEPGAAGGHFAIGMGVVKEDLSLKGETFNFYFKGEKEVLASNTDLVSYYGHIIQGQVNYRPTYTLIGYSRSKEDLLKVRDIFEEQLHRVRTEKGLEITPFYNCTTTSNEALESIKIYGNHQYLINKIFDYQTYIPVSSKAPSKDAGTLSQIRYLLKKDPEHYLPRNSFESFAKSMVYQSKKLKLKKTEYIYLPQTPSKRPLGGISYNEVLSEGKKVIDFKNARVERLEKEEWAKEIIVKENVKSDDYKKALDILENAPSVEEDKRMIDELLYSID